MATKTDDNKNQYFIAIIPPAPIFEEALTLKQYFQTTYNSKAALNSPPHITLHMPFWWKKEKEDQLVSQLKRFAEKYDPIKICLDNFSAFTPRVIYINVTESEALNQFQKSIHRFCKTELNIFNANYKELPFHPHLTLAFRDLKKDAFKEAWEEFKTKEYKAEFMADKFSLLKHDGKKWNVTKDFNLESSYSTEVKSDLETTEG
jgi:2'-5' RNA ligase